MAKSKIPLGDIKKTLDTLLLAEKYIPEGKAEGFTVVGMICPRGSDFSVDECYKAFVQLPNNHELKRKYSLHKVETGYKLVKSIGFHQSPHSTLGFYIVVQYLGMG